MPENEVVLAGEKIFLIEILTKYDQNPKNIQSVSRGKYSEDGEGEGDYQGPDSSSCR